jgi:hypothetical protein
MATAAQPAVLSALEQAKAKLQEVADATNSARTGKGPRIRVGATRGKNPQAISFEAFDESKPETLPVTQEEFMTITKSFGGDTEKTLVEWLITGFNDAQYTDASDPLAEYVESYWPADVQKQFRIVVRNYSNATGQSLEDAVKLIKPGIEAAQKK